jgi:hypothetical protein
MSRLSLIAVSFMILLTTSSLAQEPVPIILPPAPVPLSMVEPRNPMGLPPVIYTRRSDYEVWQNLAVDRYGRFRPVVIMSPYGDYYRYNGQPYPWRQLNPQNIMPYVQN